MKFLLVIFVLFSSFLGYTQNLVPNHSFEDTTSCPIGLAGIIFNSLNWYSPNASSPDLFHSCSQAITGPNVPNNSFGYQLAKSGNAYAGLGTFSTNNAREYISIKLRDSLTENQYYCFSIYISLPNNSWLASNKMGTYFSKDSIYSALTTELPYTPQIEFTQMITDTTNWVLLEAQYQAVGGGGKFITIGNFNDNFNTDTLYVSNIVVLNPYAYYFIDDVSLYACEGPLPEDSLHLTLPNVFTPNGDGENDQFMLKVLGAHNISTLTIQIFNRWGQRIVSSSFNDLALLPSNAGITDIIIWDGYTNAAAIAPSGTYYYTVNYTTTNDETFTEKSYLTLLR